jgi:beta-xylosidase
MSSNRNGLFYLFFAAGVMALSNCAAVADEQSDEAAKAAQRPKITKLGTIDLKMVETQPIVFNDKLYRLEAVRSGYAKNELSKPYLRFVDVATGEFTPPFAEHHDLSCALVVDDTMYVAATPGWAASRIDLFWSKDLKNWETATAIDLPGWQLYNTSMCRDDKRFVMAIEVGAPPEVVGSGFTSRFAVSDDMRNWKMLPEPAVYTKERYSACPAIRWIDGWYYMTYLEAVGNYQFNTFLVRSRDLATWESSPLNPVIQFEDADKQIGNEKLTAAQREEIAKALNRNNSDFDLCQWQDKVIISYSWGDQIGNEFLAHAAYDGTLAEFFKAFFPE